MKEIKILQRQLRNYPDNLFVFPCAEKLSSDVDKLAGLGICDKDGNQVGFIQIGTNDGKVIIS